MTAVEPIETLGTHSADEALRDRVRLRRTHRRLHHPDALAAEHLVEGTAVFAVPVLAPHEFAMPAKQRPWRHHQIDATRPRRSRTSAANNARSAGLHLARGCRLRKTTSSWRNTNSSQP